MKRGFLFFIPMALAAIVFAQGTEDAAALVKKLGSEDYAVREDAQKKLIEMGEDAVPALEEALKSDDLEVRLRAGRALRAIGGEAKQAEQERQAQQPAQPARPGVQQHTTSMQMVPGKVTVTVTETVDGKEETKTYEAASLEELKEKYPELAPQLGRFEFHVGRRDEFDMDKFWNEWNKGFENFDDDLRHDVEAMRRWAELWRNQPRRLRPDAGLMLPGAMLGARASMPTPVLDAQLELRGLGLVIEAVEKDTLADRLGLARFDVLVELNGHDIRSTADVAAALHGLPDGAKVTAKVMRRAQQLTLTDEGVAAPK